MAKKLTPVEKLLQIDDCQQAYEAACTVKGYKVLTLKNFTHLPEYQRAAAFGQHQVDTVAEVINEGHVYNYDDYDEDKYVPRFDMETYGDAAPGSGFVLSGVDFVNASTYVGARRSFRTSEHARWMGTTMLPAYKAFMKQ